MSAWIQDKMLHYLDLVTVEPTMILYMMAFMTTTVVEQAFFVHKACTVNHQFNSSICDNISAPEYKEFSKQVQITVSNFHLWNDVAGHIGQIVLAFFMGSWSDRRGRKLPLLLGLFGKLYYSSMIVVNSMQPTWPLEYIVYTATLPMTFTGADVAIFAAAFTYIVDTSTEKNRTMRVTILEVCYLATMPTGIALGSYLFRNVTNKSFTIMFTINASLLVLSIIYSMLRLKWRTNIKQRPLSEAKSLFLDFFDYSHVTGTAKTLFKTRINNKRRYLILLICMMGLYSFQRNEKDMMYLYVQLVFHWDYVKKFSNFKIYQSAVQDLVLVILIPLFTRVLGWRDTVIIMIGGLCHSLARVFYAQADADWYFYMGGLLAAIGPVGPPVIRSMVSKIVSVSEKGKALSVLSVADNAIPIVSGVLYSQLYNFTIHDFPSAFYYLTLATQMTVFILIVYIHFKTDDKSLLYDEKDDEGSAENSEINEDETSKLNSLPKY